MKVMEEPKVEVVILGDAVRTTGYTSDEQVCTTQYCNLQGCPEDDCGGFDW